ncbi:MAG: suppressor of fused domain protein [Prevotellaceae bacterium]|nr:suppressor of fused domain protein [Prevotellaceae bacterium]
MNRKFTEEDHEIDYELKTQELENVLGEMHNIVGHALIPFDVGGAVDMYYFNNHIPGTCFATMELLDPDGNGVLPNEFGTFELIAFTKYNYVDDTEDENTSNPFNLIERKICGIFTSIGFYAKETILRPGDTCEIPNSEGEENTCLILDFYKEFLVGMRKHHLLLCMQLFRSEMEFAMKNGSEKLFTKLKKHDYYPYSDLDRIAVI